MATREENLKKINDELEKLSDEELDGVAGGCYDGYENDKEFLRSIGFKIGSSSDVGAYQQLFKDCLGKVGVTMRKCVFGFERPSNRFVARSRFTSLSTREFTF